MSDSSLNQGLFFIFFIYGLAFLVMGIAMTLESGRSPALAEARLLRPLAAFGILHGMHEWLEFFVLQAAWLGVQAPPQIVWFRPALLAISFIALLTYGIQAFRLPGGKYPTWVQIGLGILAVYILFIISSALLTYSSEKEIPWVRLADALVRYLLAVPGATLAALGLHSQALQVREESRRPLVNNLRWAAFAFCVYGVTQVFVPALEMVPANIINAEGFLRWSGVPHQTIRSALAVIITYNLIRATQVIERVRQKQVLSAQQARLEVLEEQEALRRELLRHTVQAQEDERARIARELHDETAQVLSAFSLELGTLRNTVKGLKAGRNLERLQELSRQMSQSLYRLVHDLRPAHLDDLGLAPALNYFLEQDCCPKGLNVSFEIKGNQRRLDPIIETVLFRVAQEALNNVTRHAATKRAAVGLSYGVDQIVLQVSDAGQGFDPDERFDPPRGWGLAGMRERVEAIGGQLNVRSEPGLGTTVEALIPLTESFKQTREKNNGHDHPDAG